MQLGECAIAAADLESNPAGWAFPQLLSCVIALDVSILGALFLNMFIVLFLRPGIDVLSRLTLNPQP